MMIWSHLLLLQSGIQIIIKLPQDSQRALHLFRDPTCRSIDKAVK